MNHTAPPLTTYHLRFSGTREEVGIQIRQLQDKLSHALDYLRTDVDVNSVSFPSSGYDRVSVALRIEPAANNFDMMMAATADMETMMGLFYKPEDCPGRPFVSLSQGIMGCSLCGTQLMLPENPKHGALTVESIAQIIHCGAVRAAFTSRARSLNVIAVPAES